MSKCLWLFCICLHSESTAMVKEFCKKPSIILCQEKIHDKHWSRPLLDTSMTALTVCVLLQRWTDTPWDVLFTLHFRLVYVLTHWLLSKILFLLWSMCECAHIRVWICAYACSGPGGELKFPWSSSYRQTWATSQGYWEPNSGPLEKQRALLTAESCHQPPPLAFTSAEDSPGWIHNTNLSYKCPMVQWFPQDWRVKGHPRLPGLIAVWLSSIQGIEWRSSCVQGKSGDKAKAEWGLRFAGHMV